MAANYTLLENASFVQTGASYLNTENSPLDTFTINASGNGAFTATVIVEQSFDNVTFSTVKSWSIASSVYFSDIFTINFPVGYFVRARVVSITGLNAKVSVLFSASISSSAALLNSIQLISGVEAPAGVGNGRIYDENGSEISIGAGVFKPYLGSVAGTQMPGGIFTNNNSIQTRQVFYFADDQPFQINYGNWYAENNGLEYPGTGTLTVYASWEYPIGSTPKQFTWGGANSISINPGDDSILSDVMNNPPAPGMAGILTTYAVTTGASIHLCLRLNPRIGEENRIGNNLTNQTMTGSATPLVGGSSTNNLSYGPLNIVGMTKKQTIFEIGDSIRQGVSDDANYFNHAIGAADRQYEACRIAYGNFCITNTRASQFVSNSVRRRRSAKYYTIVDTDFGFNDLTNGRTSDQLIADLVQIRNLPELASKPFAVSTITPGTTSTDNFSTTSNQTLRAGTSEIQAFNAAVRSGSAGSGKFQFYSDYAKAIEHPYFQGRWKVGPAEQATGAETPSLSIGNYYTQDGIHPNQAGYLLFLERKVSFVWGIA